MAAEIARRLQGSLTALVTPFAADGEVDEGGLRALVDWQIAEGTRGLVPVGTTGESPTLTHREHERVVEVVVEAVAGRVPVVAGAGSNNTAEAVRFVRHAAAVGADAALAVVPYYNRPTQEGMVAHFTAMAEAADLPLVLYNIPGRSCADLLPATMAELSRVPGIVGVKDATGDVTRVSRQRALCGPGFVQLSGEDASALGFNAHGGVGCIGVTANVAPALCAAFQEAMLAGDYARALELQDRLMPLHEALFLEPGLVGAKYGLSLLGRCREAVRSPLLPPGEGTRMAIKDAMLGAWLIG